MSGGTQLSSAPSSTVDAPALPAGRVAVDLDALIVGRTLQHPIYDRDGILLLAQGAVVSSEVKKKLRGHRIDQVYVSSDDAEVASLGADLVEDCGSVFSFDSELTQKLDALIESGSMSLDDSGTAVRESVVLHGCKSYDPESRERLISQHAETSSALDKMMHQATHGGRLNTNEITTIAATYLTELTADTDNVLSAAAEAGRDTQLSQHCLQMSMLGMALAIDLGHGANAVRMIGISGLVHDWGMTRVSRALRESKQMLSNVEYHGIQKHAIYSLDMLQKVEGIPIQVPVICYQVHERLNGSGYPRGRMGESIHRGARILQVADAFIQMTSPQPYRPPLMPYAAMECLLKMASQKAVDPEIVRSLLAVQSLFPIGSLVALSDGSVARVIRRNGNEFARPFVELIQDAQGKRIDPSVGDRVRELTKGSLEVVQALPNPKRRETSLSPQEYQFQLRR